jgi:hypothetical protein
VVEMKVDGVEAPGVVVAADLPQGEHSVEIRLGR